MSLYLSNFVRVRLLIHRSRQYAAGRSTQRVPVIKSHIKRKATGRRRWAAICAVLRVCCLPPPDHLIQLVDPYSGGRGRSSTSEHSWRRRNERSKRSHHRRSPTSHRRRRHHREESSPRSPPEQWKNGRCVFFLIPNARLHPKCPPKNLPVNGLRQS
ncbi:hypothetical protein MSG28_008168 [Choristoneura fumiferana]|uniref:Uncharacterized protein n=1 Tax=Choristoneura fumiferana TaxID=7141 RepID=A0ACC0JAE5_CHOFU|nr:hypothetical protein MSG28_008168 [Choristoneura fumiferana]